MRSGNTVYQTVVGPDGLGNFLLHPLWIVNDFIPTTSLRQFETMRGRYQIPPFIPIRLPEKFGKCYYEGVRDVGVYEQMFKAGLRLPLTDLHRCLAEYLGLSFNQIAPNASRVFLGVEVLY